ncbi:unnamed protein product [Arabidopsis thaliana]|uniref:Similarity to non-LTR retroelement reverse transcriptase n=1 Tax=Arabidopsis thaliana TaxID=3702 RepID=Q9FKH8_ARATH|nr:unnamed protein product [Arabidopsis thaliana]
MRDEKAKNPSRLCITSPRIKECITSPRFSISVNGELAGFFPGQKGLRQGDPISPYLFIIVMKVLSNLLSQATYEGKFRLHPLCDSPRLTHLLFADALLIFSDEAKHSLTSISEVMKHFKELSGLDVNQAKLELFFGSYSDIQVVVLSDLQGTKLGIFPTRYLGLPLNQARICYTTLQPFIEKITNKLHAWTVGFLSFAGNIKLISSVIYGMVNFWRAVFNLSKRLYAKVDSLCATFLWKNKITNAVGAIIAWQDVCKPKEEDGLGIRLLEDFAIVFQLKQIWDLLTNVGSLWVAWIKGNILSRRCYWTLDKSPRLSGTIRNLIRLRPYIVDFMRCELNDGQTASFWFDHWNVRGPLISFIGENGPAQLRVAKEAKVSAAVRNGQWWMPRARSEAQQQLMITLTTIPPPDSSKGYDIYLWRRV